MGRIFISYRRDDSTATCGRIYDRLVAHFGKAEVFKDVDSIPLGVNFATYIRATLASCTAILVIIGPKWLTVKDAEGRRRLDDTGDMVRLEIEASFQAGKLIIPVLVDGATLPPIAALPPSLQPLALQNGMNVRYDPDFEVDIGRLIGALRPYVPPTGISLTLRHQPLNTFYDSSTPIVELDGRQYSCRWGTHFFSLSSGHHSLAIYVPYYAGRQVGVVKTTVTIDPGRVCGIDYYLPYLSTAKAMIQIT